MTYGPRSLIRDTCVTTGSLGTWSGSSRSRYVYEVPLIRYIRSFFFSLNP